MEIKETIIHALWDCQKMYSFPKKNINKLGIAHLFQLPITPQQQILHDTFCNAQTLVNAVWMLLVCSILSARRHESHLNPISIAARIKAEIKSTNKAYPKRNLARDCRYLNKAEFLASHEATGIHWTMHKMISILYQWQGIITIGLR